MPMNRKPANKRKTKQIPFPKELTALLYVAAGLLVVFLIRRMFFMPDAADPVSETSAASVSETAAPPVVQTTAAQAETTEDAQSDESIVYLTFDDGPTDNTTRILDALDAYGVKATFFVTHTYDGCEAQIGEIHKRGHCVALHTYCHKYSIYASVDDYFADLQKISDLVYDATGVRSKLLRFPGGSSNTVSRKYRKGIMTELTRAVTEKGYVYFDWNWDSMDASDRGKTAESITRYAVRAVGHDKRVILLMHDSFAKKATAEALPDIIRTYRDAGYRFDVLSEDSYCYHHTVNN